jgi:hypothetical protein
VEELTVDTINRTAPDIVAERPVRVLFFSEMTVSPASGGGHTLFNLLEPAPERCEVFYAAPVHRAAHWEPFDEIRSRTRLFDNGQRSTMPKIPRGRKLPIIRSINASIDRMNARARIKDVTRQLAGWIRELGIDVLLASPQSQLDLAVTVELLEQTGIPTVTWFMDDYYADAEARRQLGILWRRSRERYVISEAMQNSFTRAHSGTSEVLNNSVPFAEACPAPRTDDDSPLRLIYAGALNAYYIDTVRRLLEEVKGLHQQVSLDIYSHEALPAEFPTADVPVRQFPPVPSEQMRERLDDYDVLLMLSSFKPEHRAIAETSLASKWADYLASGRCILVYGPEYAENIGYAQRYDFAEVVTSGEPGGLRGKLLELAAERQKLRRRGEEAYRFGYARHNRATNRRRLWNSLLGSAEGGV